MKYTVLAKLRRWIAAVAALLATFCAGKTPPAPEPVRPEANTVSAYSAEDADYGLQISADEAVDEISDLLFGIFFEDINFAADGGLYAEKAVNRSFEYTALARDDALYGWSAVGGADLRAQGEKPDFAATHSWRNGAWRLRISCEPFSKRTVSTPPAFSRSRSRSLSSKASSTCCWSASTRSWKRASFIVLMHCLGIR